MSYYLLVHKCWDTRLFHAYAAVGEREIMGAQGATMEAALRTLARCTIPDILLAGELEALEGFPTQILTLADGADVNGMVEAVEEPNDWEE